MKEQFLKFIKENNLIKEEEEILLTVSGGIDSMTMLHLFIECGFKIVLAHCNFGLRGAESDNDQEFVERFAQKNKIPLHINRFSTLEYADKNKQSIQMAARELRYNWFNRLAKENNYAKIATGHNANDVAETFFINLSRGTGIHGLTGINVINGKVIRPMLFASRQEIKDYAEVEDIFYREDSSNAETKYLRNSIRHEILPLFEKLNPSFLKNISHTTSILKDAENIFNKNTEELKRLITNKKDGATSINITGLKEQKVTAPLLFEIIQPFGFSYDTAIRMLENIANQPGAIYYSKTYKIIKDRTNYILLPLIENEQEEYFIDDEQATFNGDINLKICRKIIGRDFNLIRNKSVGTFDAGKLKFPLKLRRWQYGDYFYPFGMRGRKKLSDYFTDQKVSIPEKENTWLLCSGDDIIWVINHRTDNRFCVNNNTKEVLQIELIN